MLRLSEVIDWNREYAGVIPGITYSNVSIVIPVKDNQDGIDRFLFKFFNSHDAEKFPSEIIIVDNNSESPIIVKEHFNKKGLSIVVHSCLQPGPASARNVGILYAKGEWILFCDSDCIPTSSLIDGYVRTQNQAIAYSGTVKASKNGYLNYFYDTERILLPHLKPNNKGEMVPLYIVTANALVWKTALLECSGFHEGFYDAAGEDVELAIRLWRFGGVRHIDDSIVLHDFNDGILGFCKRFVRYGKGNMQLQNIQNITMRPVFRRPNVSTPINHAAKLMQHICMLIGYYIEKYSSPRKK